MHHGAHAAAPALAEDLEQVLLVTVDAAVGDEAEQVERPSLAGRERESAGEHRVPRHAAPGEGLPDAGHVHVDDAAGTEGHVADLGVPHLPGRETHRFPRGLDLRHRELATHALEEGCVGPRGGVARAAVAEAEAVEHDQGDGPGHFARPSRSVPPSPISKQAVGASAQSRSRS